MKNEDTGSLASTKLEGRLPSHWRPSGSASGIFQPSAGARRSARQPPVFGVRPWSSVGSDARHPCLLICRGRQADTIKPNRYSNFEIALGGLLPSMGAPRNHRSLHWVAEGKLRNSLLALSYGEVLSMVTLGCHVGHIVMDISKMIWDEVRFLHERVDGVSELGIDTSHQASLLLVEHFVCRWGISAPNVLACRRRPWHRVQHYLEQASRSSIHCHLSSSPSRYVTC